MKLLNAAILAIFLAFNLTFAGTAAAHSDDYLDTVKAPHGGQLRMAGIYHYELVLKPTGNGTANDILVYVTDHAGKDINTVGATGTVTILAGSKASVALKAEGKNVMQGAGNFGLTPNLKAVVSIALPGQAPSQARFTPLAPEHVAHSHKH